MRRVVWGIMLLAACLGMAQCIPEEKEIRVTGISLDASTLKMKVGESKPLTATVEPADATNKKISWTSDKEAVATVDQQGKVDAKAVGTAKISVTSEDGHNTATCLVTVTEASAPEVAVESVTVDASLSLEVEESKQLTATVLPAKANQKVTWRSDKEDVATVDVEGNVKGLKAGTATITATTEGKDKDGHPKEAKCTVTVKVVTASVESMALSATTLTLEVNKSKQLTATVLPAEASQRVTWTSDKEEVATVDAEGNVKALKAGTATITATTVGKDEHGNPKKAECVVTVTEVSVASVTPSATTLSLKINESKQLTATVLPAEANQKVTWKSDKEDVATVDAEGNVKGLKAGTATITATTVGKDEHGNPKKAGCVVTVEGIVLQEKLTITLYDRWALAATVLPAGSELEWSSADAEVVNIADGFAYGKKLGTTTVTASLKDDPATKAQCEVTVDLSEEVKKGVYLNWTGLVLQQEGSFLLLARVNGELVTRCTWQSSDKSIASVSRGQVTAKKKAGKATITVNYEGRTATCLVVVAKNSYSEPHVTGISMGVGAHGRTIAPGETQKKPGTFSVTPPNAATKDVIWSSSNALAVKVDPHTGEITGVHPDAAKNVDGTVHHSGVATITAITVDGHKTGKYTAVTKYSWQH